MSFLNHGKCEKYSLTPRCFKFWCFRAPSSEIAHCYERLERTFNDNMIAQIGAEKKRQQSEVDQFQKAKDFLAPLGLLNDEERLMLISALLQIAKPEPRKDPDEELCLSTFLTSKKVKLARTQFELFGKLMSMTYKIKYGHPPPAKLEYVGSEAREMDVYTLRDVCMMEECLLKVMPSDKKGEEKVLCNN